MLLDFCSSPEEDDYWDDSDGDSYSLAGMAMLRSDILSGDLRALYLAWLWMVDQGGLRDEIKEPLPGIGPLNATLKSFANFLRIDPDLVAAAAEGPAGSSNDKKGAKVSHAAIKDMPDDEKTRLLCRIADGDPHVVLEIRKIVNDADLASASAARTYRTASELRIRSEQVREERHVAERKQREVEQERRRIREQQVYQERLDAIFRKGESAWQDVEKQLKIKSGRSYDAAAQLLSDLKTLADRNGSAEEYFIRLEKVRRKHANKPRFLERLMHLQH